MELDWSTLILEVINFLILVWLLKRFLYQPVLNMVAQRRQKIESELTQARSGQEQASSLQQQYEERLSDWEQEKRGMLDELEQQVEQERGKRLQQLDGEMEQQRLKHQARDQQQQTQWRDQAGTEALQLGSAFAARLLTSLSGPELDLRLQQLFIDQLAALPEDQLRQLREGWNKGDTKVEVTSTAPLDETRQQTIRQALEQKLDADSNSKSGSDLAQWEFTVDASLIAGLRVSIGSWMLHANLQDELRFFTEAAASNE